jgi:hypothetical protein
MDLAGVLLTPPAHREAWLILGCVLVVLVGARLAEGLARLHFARARRWAERGFEYDPDEDHYRCPEGERLHLHVLDEAKRVAVYRAPAARCNGCRLKAACTPHDEGRHLYRPLAAWAETDVGRFHQFLSLLMFGAGGVLSGAGLFRWGGGPGTGMLLLALLTSLGFFLGDLRQVWTAAAPEPSRCAEEDTTKSSSEVQ